MVGLVVVLAVWVVVELAILTIAWLFIVMAVVVVEMGRCINGSDGGDGGDGHCVSVGYNECVNSNGNVSNSVFGGSYIGIISVVI